MFGKIRPSVPPSYEYYEDLTNEHTRNEAVFAAESELMQLDKVIRLNKVMLRIKRLGWMGINALGWGLTAHGFTNINPKIQDSFDSEGELYREDWEDDGY